MFIDKKSSITCLWQKTYMHAWDKAMPMNKMKKWMRKTQTEYIISENKIYKICIVTKQLYVAMSDPELYEVQK